MNIYLIQHKLLNIHQGVNEWMIVFEDNTLLYRFAVADVKEFFPVCAL